MAWCAHASSMPQKQAGGHGGSPTRQRRAPLTTLAAGWWRAASRARAEEQMRAEELDRPEPAPHPRPQLPMLVLCTGLREGR